MTLYSASRDHMRTNYIAHEKRRNAYKGEHQTDEELGEEFDQGMADIEAAAREVPPGWTQGGEEFTRETHPGLFEVIDAILAPKVTVTVASESDGLRRALPDYAQAQWAIDHLPSVFGAVDAGLAYRGEGTILLGSTLGKDGLLARYIVALHNDALRAAGIEVTE